MLSALEEPFLPNPFAPCEDPAPPADGYVIFMSPSQADAVINVCGALPQGTIVQDKMPDPAGLDVAKELTELWNAASPEGYAIQGRVVDTLPGLADESNRQYTAMLERANDAKLDRIAELEREVAIKEATIAATEAEADRYHKLMIKSNEQANELMAQCQRLDDENRRLHRENCRLKLACSPGALMDVQRATRQQALIPLRPPGQPPKSNIDLLKEQVEKFNPSFIFNRIDRGAAPQYGCIAIEAKDEFFPDGTKI